MGDHAADQWLRQKPDQVMEAKAASSFPGIKVTLLHMVEEREWIGHLELVSDLFQQGLNDDPEFGAGCIG